MADRLTEKYRFEGLALSTRPIPGRKERIPAELIRQLPGKIAPGSPLGYNHGIEERGRLTRVWTREASDGATELWVAGEADVPIGEDPRDYLGSGLSPSLIAHYKDHTGEEHLLIAADPLSFSKRAMSGARRSLEAAGLQVYVTDFFLYAELPPPSVVVELSRVLIPVLQGVGGAAIWSGIQGAVVRLVGHNTRKDTDVYVSFRAGDVELRAKIPSDSVEARHVLREFFEEAQRQIAKRSATPFTSQLAALAELHAEGVLTDEEFSAKKSELLARI